MKNGERKKLLTGILVLLLLVVMGLLMAASQCAGVMERQGVTSPLELFDLPVPAVEPGE